MNGCVNAKKVIKDIRGYLTFIVRFSGSRSDSPYTFRHKGYSDGLESHGHDISYEPANKGLIRIFFYCDTMQKVFNNGRTMLKKWNLQKLDVLCEYMLNFTLTFKTVDILVEVSTFLHSLMRIAGYGRALKFSSAPKSAKELLIDKHNISDKVFESYLNLHTEAEEAGFHLVKPNEWLSKCISFWKSTSAGVASSNIDLVIDGKDVQIKARSKLSIGVINGEKLFRREMLSKKHDKFNPAKVGYRDVPYKATRAIYVLPLYTLHVQVVLFHHLTDYIATKGKYNAKYGNSIDASFIFSLGRMRVLEYVYSIIIIL